MSNYKGAYSATYSICGGCRVGSSDEDSFDGLADITAALERCTRHNPRDVGSGDHSLSQGPEEAKSQNHALAPQHSGSTLSLSGDNSSQSLASKTDIHLHEQASVQAAVSDTTLQSQAKLVDEEESRFMKKLQEFQKGTAVLRQQISSG